MDNLRERWNVLVPWMTKMNELGTDLARLITDAFPNLQGRDFKNPDSFTDEELIDIFNWLEQE